MEKKRNDALRCLFAVIRRRDIFPCSCWLEINTSCSNTVVALRFHSSFTRRFNLCVLNFALRWRVSQLSEGDVLTVVDAAGDFVLLKVYWSHHPDCQVLKNFAKSSRQSDQHINAQRSRVLLEVRQWNEKYSGKYIFFQTVGTAWLMCWILVVNYVDYTDVCHSRWASSSRSACWYSCSSYCRISWSSLSVIEAMSTVFLSFVRLAVLALMSFSSFPRNRQLCHRS